VVTPIPLYSEVYDMSCTAHPKYKAIYPPRLACQECWEIYAQRHPAEFLNLCVVVIQVCFDLITYVEVDSEEE